MSNQQDRRDELEAPDFQVGDLVTHGGYGRGRVTSVTWCGSVWVRFFREGNETCFGPSVLKKVQPPVDPDYEEVRRLQELGECTCRAAPDKPCRSCIAKVKTMELDELEAIELEDCTCGVPTGESCRSCSAKMELNLMETKAMQAARNRLGIDADGPPRREPRPGWTAPLKKEEQPHLQRLGFSDWDWFYTCVEDV